MVIWFSIKELLTKNSVKRPITRDRNNAAVVMQKNFTELKSEINASQRIDASECLKKYWWYSIQFHDVYTTWTMIWWIKVFSNRRVV